MLVGNDAYEPSTEDILAEVVLASSQASVTFSSLDTLAAGYQHLQIRAVSRNDRNVAYTLGDVFLRVNGATSAYRSHYLRGNGSTVSSNGFSPASGMVAYTNPSDPAPANIFAGAVIDILDPFSSSKNTTIRSLAGVHTGGTGTGDDNIAELYSGLYNATTAVSSLQLIADAGNFLTGSRFTLIGLK
jgi:hypothetical protein